MEFIDKTSFKTNSKDFIRDLEKLIQKEENENSKPIQKKNINFQNFEELKNYLYNLILKIEDKKFNTKKNENMLINLYEKLKFLKNKEIPLFVDISIFVPENMEKVSNFLKNKKKFEKEIIQSSKRKESFFTCDENSTFLEKSRNQENLALEKNFKNQTQIFIPKINKFRKLKNNCFRDKTNINSDFTDEENIRNKMIVFPRKKKIRKSKIGFLLNSKKFTKDISNKIDNLKFFWKDNENYPNLFIKKKLVKFSIDGNVYFEEVVDFTAKKIPS